MSRVQLQRNKEHSQVPMAPKVRGLQWTDCSDARSLRPPATDRHLHAMDTPIASRLHLVDAYPRGTSQPHNFLFRGNNPMSKNNSTFPLSSLEKMLRGSSLQECDVAVPESIRFVDLFLKTTSVLLRAFWLRSFLFSLV